MARRPFSTLKQLLAANLAVLGVEAFGLGVRFGHVFAVFGLAIVFVCFAVIDLAGVVGPDLAGTAARRLRHR